jgi:hypothetical protein
MSRILADVEFKGLHGRAVVGAYGACFSIGLHVKDWDTERAPQVLLVHAPVLLQSGLLVGLAVPETAVPISLGSNGYSTALLFDLIITGGALEIIERHRAGGDIVLILKLRSVITRDGDRVQGQDDVICRISQSDWLRFLRECGYGRSMLFEIPLSTDNTKALPSAQKDLARARQYLLQGHYQEVIGTCRRVLEAITEELGQQDELHSAKKLFVEKRESLTICQRELLLRQAAINYAHLAHHADGRPDASFDRSDATMILGITASLVTAALDRATAGLGQQG